MRYSIKFRPSVEKSLKKLPQKELIRIKRKIDALAENLPDPAITKMKGKALQQSIDKPQAVKSRDEVRRFLSEAIERTRSLTAELSPLVLYELGFEAALEWLVKNAREQYGLSAQFEDDGLDKPVSEDIRVMI